MDQVTTSRLEYNAMRSIWQKCRDAADGEDTVKAEGTRYLPKLGPDQDEAKYEAYKMRASFYNATGRTIAGLSGMLFRQDPIVEVGVIEGITQNVTLADIGVEEFAQHAADQVLEVGRGGVLVDFPQQNEEISAAMARELRIHPIWAWYDTENIINWRYDMRLGQDRLSLLILVEEYEEPDPDDYFKTIYVTHYRHLGLDENGEYYQMLYREIHEDEIPENAMNYREHPHKRSVRAVWDEPYYPTRNGGERITEIPFVWFSTVNRGAEIQRPPLIDLINMNFSHYRHKADHNHGLHYAALPTPVLTGVSPEDAPTSIGPQEMWVLPSSDAKATMLEAVLPGLEQLAETMKSEEWQMATLGARMLAPDRADNETATAAAIRHMGETSTLADISRAVSNSMTSLLVITNEWMGADSEDVTFKLSTDFIPVSMSSAELIALVDSWQKGAISYDTLFENLQRGEIISADKTTEEETDEIETSMVPIAGEG